MKYLIKVKTRQKNDSVEPDLVDPKTLVVRTKKLPIEGKANEAVIQLLSKYFSVPKVDIKIIRGQKSKNKVVEISKG